MTLKHDLKTQLGRDATKAELKAAKAAALSAVTSNSGPNPTAEPDAASFVLQLVTKETVDKETNLVLAHGQFTKRNMLVSYKGKHVITTLEDVRTKAKKSFEVNSDNGLRVYLGESLMPDNLVFISDESEWREEIHALIHGSNGTLPSRFLFVPLPIEGLDRCVLIGLQTYPFLKQLTRASAHFCAPWFARPLLRSPHLKVSSKRMHHF